MIDFILMEEEVPCGLFYGYDFATIDQLLELGDGYGLPQGRLATVGYTVDANDFEVTLRTAREEHEVKASAEVKSDGRWFAVVELAKPLVHGICQVEIISSKAPIPPDQYVGVNQLHYVLPAPDLISRHDTLPPDITGLLETPVEGFHIARIESGADTHIKIRDHSAMDLMLHQIGEVAWQHGS